MCAKKNLEDVPYERHPSYGMIKVAMAHGRTALFGSAVQSNNFVVIEVHTASVKRDLNCDWTYSERMIIELRMSMNQFSEMIFNRNTEGVPCTLRRFRDPATGEVVKPDEPPPQPRAQKNYEEFQDLVGKVAGDVRAIADDLEEGLRGRAPGKGELRDILARLKKAAQQIDSDMPYVMRTFDEKVERTVTEAKAEVQAFTGAALRAAGMERIAEGHVPDMLLLGKGGEEEP